MRKPVYDRGSIGNNRKNPNGTNYDENTNIPTRSLLLSIADYLFIALHPLSSPTRSERVVRLRSMCEKSCIDYPSQRHRVAKVPFFSNQTDTSNSRQLSTMMYKSFTSPISILSVHQWGERGQKRRRKIEHGQKCRGDFQSCWHLAGAFPSSLH
jgi:hypothetical protein